jgi:outer membrane receptor for ferrienterochelin and colicins
MMNKQKHIATLCMASLLCAAPAFGQSAPSQGLSEDELSYSMDPVVVTGSYTPQHLKNSAVPVAVLNSSAMKNAGITDLQSALEQLVPSLSFSPNSMGSYLRMNGLSNKHVLILVNGRKVGGDISGNVDLSQINMSNVKQIEYITGAASTLYGSDAIGGVINIILKEGGEKSSFTSDSRYKNKNRFDQTLGLNLRAGKVTSTTNYYYSHSDGWQNSNLTESGEDLIETLAPLSFGYSSNNFSERIEYKPTQRLTTYANVGYYRKLTDRPAAQEDVTGGYTYNLHYEGFQWGAGGAYRLNGYNGVLKLDYSGNTLDQAYKYMEDNSYSFTKKQDFHQLTATGQWNFTENSTSLVGVDYKSESLERPQDEVDKQLSTYSLFVQHEHKLFDLLTLSAGVRYDNHQTVGSRVTPKFSLMCSPGNFNFRASYAAGYRTPGIDEMYYHMLKAMGSRYTISLGNEDLKSESSNYVSVNAEYHNRFLSASVTGYMNFVKNMVTSASTKYNDMTSEEQAELLAEFPEIADLKSTKNLSVKHYFNFEKANIKGLEANVTAHVAAGLSLHAGYNLAYSRGLNDDGEWQDLNRAIKHSATYAANYSHGWRDYTLNVNLNGRVQSKVYYPGDADGDAPGFGILSLNTRHTFTGFRDFVLEPSIGIDNLFNRRDNRPLNKNFANYSPGRSLMLGLNIKL